VLSNSATGFSAFDVWYPSGPTVKPQVADVPDPTKTAAHQVSLLPLIPSVTYNFKF
jgi:hypothetical protein